MAWNTVIIPGFPARKQDPDLMGMTVGQNETSTAENPFITTGFPAWEQDQPRQDEDNNDAASGRRLCNNT